MRKFIFDLLEKELEIGSILQNKYKIESVIGKGSYGLTYLVQILPNNGYAVLKQNRKRKGKKGLQSFRREAHILSLFNHPSIPKLLDFFEWDDSYFIVMEEKLGKTVEQLIFEDKNSFSERESFQILEKVLYIVRDIHEKGIIHLDLRTPNILLQNEQVYIIDFGLAKFLKEGNSTIVDEKKVNSEPNITDDLYELGHFLLFLLYSGFEPSKQSKKRDSWQDELTLSPLSRLIIDRLLLLKKPYKSTSELIAELNYLLQSELYNET